MERQFSYSWIAFIRAESKKLKKYCKLILWPILAEPAKWMLVNNNGDSILHEQRWHNASETQQLFTLVSAFCTLTETGLYRTTVRYPMEDQMIALKATPFWLLLHSSPAHSASCEQTLALPILVKMGRCKYIKRTNCKNKRVMCKATIPRLSTTSVYHKSPNKWCSVLPSRSLEQLLPHTNQAVHWVALSVGVSLSQNLYPYMKAYLKY